MSSRALITRNEAAELSGAAPSAVNKAIESRLVTTVSDRRRALLRAQDVSVLALFASLSGAGLALSAAQRRRLARWARSSEPELALSGAVVVRRPAEVISAQQDAERYVAQRARFLEINPDVQGGEPVIRGTRVPIRGLAKQIEQGERREVLEAEYDYIDSEAFEFAVRWARANPRRGRPAQPKKRSKGYRPRSRGAHLTRRQGSGSAAGA